MDNKGFEKHATDPGDAPTLVIEKDSPVDDALGKSSKSLQENGSVGTGLTLATKPYAGMGKEDLLRFSQTPFWVRMRTIFLVLFWLVWLGLLTSVIVLTIIAPRCAAPPEQDWWQKSTMYQIYVRSFQDSDGDGVGDLKGIERRLDYLQKIHVNTLVLSSVYHSHISPVDGIRPDRGYDVIDHRAISPDYGTIEDLESLLEEAHKRDIRVILDFIPNHTGSEHHWFTESKKGRNQTNPFWNYYVWSDCTSTTPPNNWLSVYGNSSWRYDSERDECYLHQFLRTQPELNLRSGAVRDELEGILRFWLDKGVDGFRVNSAAFLFEDSDLRDEESSGHCPEDGMDYHCLNHTRTYSQREIHDLIGRWRAVLEEVSAKTQQYRILITDADDDIAETVLYYQADRREGSHFPLNFGLSRINDSCDGKCIYELVDEWMYNLPNDSNADWLSGTQDIRRLRSRVTGSRVDAMNMLMMTLPGASITYYGEELGMKNTPLGSNPIQDPIGHINPEWNRDPMRTPMLWDSSPHAGFVNGSGDPWLPVDQNFTDINVEVQNETDGSHLKLFTHLAKLRQDQGALNYGKLYYVISNQNIFSYIRKYDGVDRLMVIINFGNQDATNDYEHAHYMVPSRADVVLTTGDDVTYKAEDNIITSEITLKPNQGLILKWDYNR